jgi:hypothetical protein
VFNKFQENGFPLGIDKARMLKLAGIVETVVGTICSKFYKVKLKCHYFMVTIATAGMTTCLSPNK